MKAMEPGSDEEDTPKHRISQAVPQLKVLEGLYSKETEPADQGKK